MTRKRVMRGPFNLSWSSKCCLWGGECRCIVRPEGCSIWQSRILQNAPKWHGLLEQAEAVCVAVLGPRWDHPEGGGTGIACNGPLDRGGGRTCSALQRRALLRRVRPFDVEHRSVVRPSEREEADIVTPLGIFPAAVVSTSSGRFSSLSQSVSKSESGYMRRALAPCGERGDMWVLSSLSKPPSEVSL